MVSLRSGKQRASPSATLSRRSAIANSHAAIRGQSSAVKSGDDFLATDAWKQERQEIIIGHGERGLGGVAISIV